MDEKEIYRFDYNFESYSGEMDHERFVRKYEVKIYALTEEGLVSEEIIGTVTFTIVFINHARNSGADMLYVIDSDEYMSRHGFEIFDIETNEIKTDIIEHYNGSLFNSDFCLLEKIEILPEHRGKGLGKIIIKDIIFHFASTVGLFITQPFPLQFEPKRKEDSGLEYFSHDESIALNQLRKYYIEMGFEMIPNYDELLFYNPAFINPKMDSIILD